MTTPSLPVCLTAAQLSSVQVHEASTILPSYPQCLLLPSSYDLSLSLLLAPLPLS